MFKRISFAFLIYCISISSFAYVIDTNFTIDNQTNSPMALEIEQPNGQPSIDIAIFAHESKKINLSKGDKSGLLYQKSSAPFKVKVNDQVVVHGRVVYYVGASLGNKYSFLNAVSASDGVTTDLSYSCKNGGYGKTFTNKIVISGTPDKALEIKRFPADLSCQGLKSSTFDGRYTPTCFDGSSTTFYKKRDYAACAAYTTSGEEQTYLVHLGETKGRLDYQIGYLFCETWM
jgi:hypothetical protein